MGTHGGVVLLGILVGVALGMVLGLLVSPKSVELVEVPVITTEIVYVDRPVEVLVEVPVEISANPEPVCLGHSVLIRDSDSTMYILDFQPATIDVNGEVCISLSEDGKTFIFDYTPVSYYPSMDFIIASQQTEIVRLKACIEDERMC